MNEIDFNSYDYVIGWGTGSYAESVVQKNLGYLNVDFFVDSKVSGENFVFEGKEVWNPVKLSELCSSGYRLLVIVMSSFFDEILDVLDSRYPDVDYLPASVFDEAEIDSVLESPVFDDEKRGLIVTVSRNNYNNYIGGTSKLIREQVEKLELHGYSLGHLYWRTAKIDNKSRHIFFFVTNGKVRFVERSMLQLILGKVDKFIVHNIIDMSQDVLVDILGKIKVKPIFYLHDYSYMCRNITLMKPGSGFCRSFRSDWRECSTCPYESSSVQLRSLMNHLLSNFSPVFLAPSEIVKEHYLEAFPNMDIKVIPHWFFRNEFFLASSSPIINVAYVGRQSENKGWETFKKLVSEYRSGFEFFYFGIDKEEVDGCKNIYLNENESGHSSVVKELIKYKIDAVAILSQCPETYSFVLYEAYQAGCWIVTMAGSGNVERNVRNFDSGIVFDGEKEIIEGFSSVLNCQGDRVHYVPFRPEINPEFLRVVKDA